MNLDRSDPMISGTLRGEFEAVMEVMRRAYRHRDKELLYIGVAGLLIWDGEAQQTRAALTLLHSKFPGKDGLWGYSLCWDLIFGR